MDQPCFLKLHRREGYLTLGVLLRQRWPIAACLALAVVGGAGVANFFSSQVASPYKAMLAVSDRLVTLRGETQADYAQVHGDGVVNPGDALKTDERGTALLTYYDGSTVALSPLTDLVVERLEGVELRTLYLSVGRVAITVNKLLSEGSRYEVRTPSATIGVRGTRFVITVTPDGRTDVEVSEGRVELGAAGEKLALGAGEGGVVERPGGRPQKKGVAASPSPPPPAPPPSPPPTPVAALPLAIQADKTSISLDERFSYCMTGNTALTEIVRLGVVYPDGSFQTQGWERTFGDVANRCRSFTFESNSRYVSGPYTFRWRINGNPLEFSITLLNGNVSAQQTPAPARTPEPSQVVSAPGPAPAPARSPSPPAGPNVYARPGTVKPGDVIEFVMSGFPLPVTVIHTERLMPDGRAIPFGNTHTWPGPWDTWWIHSSVGKAGEPWPSGRYIDRFVVSGTTYEAAVMVDTPAGATLAPAQVTATVIKDGASDLVTFQVTGFLPLTDVLYKERVETDGRVTAVNRPYTMRSFELTIRLTYSAAFPRGVYRHRFVINGKTYEVAATLP